MMITEMRWVWRDFGHGHQLYTTTGGAKVVICGDKGSRLVVRDADGYLVPVEPDQPVAKLIEAAPELLEACRNARAWINTTQPPIDVGAPGVAAKLDAAIKAAG